MKRVSNAKHVRTLAWLVIACLALTNVMPSFTSFAAWEDSTVTVSDNENYDNADTSDAGAAEKEDDADKSLSEDDGESQGAESENKEDGGKADKEDTSGDTGSSDGEDSSAGEGEFGKNQDDDSDEDSKEDSREDSKEDTGADSEADSKEDQNADSTADGHDGVIESPDDKISESEDVLSGKEDGYEGPATVSGEVKKDKVTSEEEDEQEEDAWDGIIDKLSAASPSEASVCVVGAVGYPSIASASDAIRRNGGSGTIRLLGDVTEDVVIDGKIDREIKDLEITLDLGGFDLYGRFDVKGGADVTFTNGTVNSGTRYSWIYASGDDDRPTRFTLAEDAVIETVSYGLCICGPKGSDDHDGFGYDVSIDGTIYASDPSSAGIWLQGNMRNTEARVCSLTVSGTVISGDESGAAIAINGWGNVIVKNGAYIKGATGIEIRSGSLTVEGGTIIGTAEQYESWENNNGSSSKGAGISINEHSTARPVKVDISGGDISGYYALAQDNTQHKEDKVTVSVSGGTFTGYDEDCAILIREYGDGNGVFSITGGTFLNGQGEKSDISAYLTDTDYVLDDNGNIIPADSFAGGSDSDDTEDDSGNTGGSGDTEDDSGNDSGSDDTVDDSVSDNDSGSGDNTGVSGSGGGSHHGGSGGGRGIRPAGVASEAPYIGVNGMKADWHLEGNLFTETDGTHPSNEYLRIGGVVYAFYTNGYAIPFDQIKYYSEAAIAAAGDIPEAEGSWNLCGWRLQYSDGSAPHNDWAQLTHNGRTDWYYFDEDGWMQTGWKQIGGYWYYLGEDGAMLSSTLTPDGHRVDASGRLVR